MPVLTHAAAFVAGASLWTLLEYIIHRFGGHERRLGESVSREHLMHHARPDQFSTTAKKLALAVPVLTVLFALVTLVADAGIAAALTAGTGVCWTSYEMLHRATHVRGPTNVYGTWARRHHLAHHFGNPRMNHGVTTPLWDIVFGTYARPDVINVPRRHVHAFPWLVDETGAAIPRFATVYRVG